MALQFAKLLLLALQSQLLETSPVVCVRARGAFCYNEDLLEPKRPWGWHTGDRAPCAAAMLTPPTRPPIM